MEQQHKKTPDQTKNPTKTTKQQQTPPPPSPQKKEQVRGA